LGSLPDNFEAQLAASEAAYDRDDDDLVFFVPDESEQFVHLGFFDFAGDGRIGQLGGLRLNPQGDRTMVYPEMAGDPAQVHPIHVQLQRLLPHFFGISPSLRLGRILDLTEHAAIALAAAICFSGSILPFCSVTFWTFNHSLVLASLAQFLATLHFAAHKVA
jgi:hypothetical protein